MSLKPLQITLARSAEPDPQAGRFRELAIPQDTPLDAGSRRTSYPKCARDLPHLLALTAADMARGGTRVPDRDRTYPRPDTFAGVCRDFSPETVMAAARLGFFPCAHFDPLKWWTRKDRMVLFLEEQHIGKRLRRDMKKTAYRVTFDKAFDEVIKACAGRRKGRHAGLTWITPKIMQVYSQLHRQGHSHSFEVWSADGRLVGGGYGIAVGRVFFAESQFSRESNTSKMGFAMLNHHLAKWGFLVNDGKQHTPVIEAMGFREIPSRVRGAARPGTAVVRPGAWTVETDLAAIAA